MTNNFLQFSTEITHALQNNLPIVALESTIIAHGMPYPENVETGLQIEKAVRNAGAVPATIAVMDGKLRVGLSEAELECLGKEGPSIPKLSRRDLPIIVSQKKPGATTVASTAIIAGMAGIQIFATGGIGGVHRGAADTFDISADLQELARNNVAVISAGAKAILDLPLTLEYLETHGVPVIGYRTNEFPAFYTRKSGLSLEYSFDSPEEIAQALHTKWSMKLNGGVLIANPIPAEHEADYRVIQDAIEKALMESTQQNIRGKQLTPFLLARIKEITGGDSLKANIQLALNNARLGGKVAVALLHQQSNIVNLHNRI